MLSRTVHILRLGVALAGQCRFIPAISRLSVVQRLSNHHRMFTVDAMSTSTNAETTINSQSTGASDSASKPEYQGTMPKLAEPGPAQPNAASLRDKFLGNGQTDLALFCTPREHRALTTPPEAIDLVIYHGSCYDGAGAMWAAWRKLGSKAKYYAMQHRDQLPPVSGKNVALVDIAFEKRIMLHIVKHAKSLVVLDHHVSVADALKSVPNRMKVFDINRSGAILSWEYFHPREPIPDVLLYVQDRDLWHWKLPDSEAFNAMLMLKPAKIETFEAVYQGGASAIDEMIKDGRPLAKFAQRTFETIARNAYVRKFKTGHSVNVVNCSVFKSEVGNLLVQRPGVHFAMVWHFDHGRKEYRISLRSQEGPMACDVSIIAKSFGGGGHAMASAFNYRGNIEELFATEDVVTSKPAHKSGNNSPTDAASAEKDATNVPTTDATVVTSVTTDAPVQQMSI